MQLVHYHFPTIGSTNTWAKEHAVEFDLRALTLITADEQTAGRGRFKRVWSSPKEVNIYATFAFFVEQSHQDLGHIPQLLALAASQTIENLSLKPTLKWPNDVLLNGKKIGGILCETVMEKNRRCVICGIGLNVNMPQAELQKIDRPATSLLVETNVMHSREEILKNLSHTFSSFIHQFIERGFDPFFSAYQERSYLQAGQVVCFHDNQKIVEGLFHSLNQDGSVTLQLSDGTFKSYYAGEFV